MHLRDSYLNWLFVWEFSRKNLRKLLEITSSNAFNRKIHEISAKIRARIIAEISRQIFSSEFPGNFFTKKVSTYCTGILPNGLGMRDSLSIYTTIIYVLALPSNFFVRIPNFFVQILYPGRIQTFPVHVCLLLLWKTILGMFNCLSYCLLYTSPSPRD